MSGVAILRAVFVANAALTETVPADDIVGEALPLDTPTPALALELVSSVDRKVLKAGIRRRVTDRVQVTTHAIDATERELVARLVKRAGADQIGDFDEFTEVSILADGRGPDFQGPTGIRMATQDFSVSYNEPTGTEEPAFDPASLFAAAEVGVWYDPSDISTMFQDSAGSIAAVVNGPVGRINDKSGGGRHATQGTSSARPMLRLEGNRHYLEFDGIDDHLRAIFTIANPFTRVSAIRQLTWTDSDRIFGAGAVVSNGELYQRTASPQIALTTSTSSGAAGNGGAAIGVDAVVSEYFDAVGQTLTINGGIATTGGAGTASPGGITLGASRFNGNAANFRCYGVLMIARALIADEAADLREFMAIKGGVML